MDNSDDVAAGRALALAYRKGGAVAAEDADVADGRSIAAAMRANAANDTSAPDPVEAHYATSNPIARANSALTALNPIARANSALTALVQPINARIGQAVAPLQVGADPATLPESAAAMRPTGAPSAPVDAAATFEKISTLRKKLIADGKRPETDPEYVGLLREQATGVAQNDRAAANFIAPPGLGIAGRVTALADRAANLLPLAPAEAQRAIANPLPVAPLEAPDALTTAMLDRLDEAGIRPSRPSAFPDNQLRVRAEPTIAEPVLPTALPAPGVSRMPVQAEAARIAPPAGGNALTEPPASPQGPPNRLAATPEPPPRMAAEPEAAAGSAAQEGSAGGLFSSKLSKPRAELADLAVNKYGLPLTVDQISEHPVTQKTGQMLRQMPMTGMNSGELQTPFNQAVARTFDGDLSKSGGKITSEVMSAAKDKLGATFDRIANQTKIIPDDALLGGLAKIESMAGEIGLETGQHAAVVRQVHKIVDAAAEGRLSGELYQSLTHKGEALDLLQHNQSPGVSRLASMIREELDDVMHRSLVRDGKAGLADELAATRFKYKNMMTVAPLVAKAANGDISPALLNGVVTRNFKNRAFTGAGDLGELAQIGQAFVKGPVDSGTPMGMHIVRILTSPHTALAGTGGVLAALNPDVAALAAAGYGTGLATSRYLAKRFQDPKQVNKLIQKGLDQP